MSKIAFITAFAVMATSGAAYAQEVVVGPVPAPPAVVAPGPVIGEEVTVARPPLYDYDYDYVEEQPAPVYHRYVEAPAPIYSQRVVVGDILPPGVAIYPAPAEYGVTGYRYSVLDDEPVLVDPATRRVVEVLY